MKLGIRIRKMVVLDILILLSFLAALLFTNIPVFADTVVDTARMGTITITECPADGQEITAYRVADMDSNGKLVAVSALSEVLKNTGIDVSQLTSDTTAEDMSLAAQTLRGYVMADTNSFEARSATVLNNSAQLTNLKPGLYLVVSKNLTIGNTTYIFDPYLITVPMKTPDGNYMYDRSVKATKFSSTSVKKFKNQVIKLWKNDKQEVRPASVVVDIYNGSYFYKRVELNADNNWSFTWEGEGDWSVKEHMEGLNAYTNSVSSSFSSDELIAQTSFMVTNTAYPPNGDSNLPDTGDTAPIFAAAALLLIGGVCVAFGLYKRNRNKR